MLSKFSAKWTFGLNLIDVWFLWKWSSRSFVAPQTDKSLWPNDTIWQHKSRVSCKKGPTRHAYPWQIGPFWQDTLEMWVTISSGDGLLPHNTKPLPEPILTYHLPGCSAALTWEQFTRALKLQMHFLRLHIEITTTSARANRLTFSNLISFSTATANT